LGLSDKEILPTLLKYWVEHNKQHGEELRKWANKATEFGGNEINKDITEAVNYLDKANESLLRAAGRLREGI
jgi:hypothetical protein